MGRRLDVRVVQTSGSSIETLERRAASRGEPLHFDAHLARVNRNRRFLNHLSTTVVTLLGLTVMGMMTTWLLSLM
jgi:hypothetical protein